MSLMIKIEETAEISNRELIKHIENMKDDERTWLIERLNKMDTFSKEIWHFITSARKLIKRDLTPIEMIGLLRECNNVQNLLLKKIRLKNKDKIGIIL